MASGVIFANGAQSGNQPRMRRLAEKAAQTFIMGVPVMLEAATNAIKEWDGVTVAQGICGISKEPASNLTTTGVKQFQSLANNPVPNQPLAQKIVRGAPYNDGRIGFELADTDIQFWAQVGPSQTQANVGAVGNQFGMTKDSDGHWFVDTTKVGAAAVCQVVKFDTIDAVRGVYIVFLPTVQQLLL